LGGQLHWSGSRTACRALPAALLPAVNLGLSSCLPPFFRGSRRSVAQKAFLPQPRPEYHLRKGLSSLSLSRELLPARRTLTFRSYVRQCLRSAPEPEKSPRRQSPRR